jgi:arylsulfatase A-like enzyme
MARTTPSVEHEAPSCAAPKALLPVALGTGCFLAWQFLAGLWRLANRSGGMDNKFSALARDKFLEFLIGQNLQVSLAYLLLWVAGILLILPLVSAWTRRARINRRTRTWIALRAFLAIALIHGWFMLRLVHTRPYFLSDATFGSWYYQVLDWPPVAAKPVLHTLLFVILPIVFGAWVCFWYLRRSNRRSQVIGVTIALIAAASLAFANWHRPAPPAHAGAEKAPYNILILSSDSLRGDKLGCAGYRPARTDGLAAAGVSPAIDSLAARSTRFERCFTPIASTLESSVSFMGSQFPHTHGIRQMYPDRATVEAMEKKLVPMARVLGEHGYDTAAIGDWCAGYYQVVPLGFKDVSVSSFDNFKIYMSQAVIMAHFVVPLYFDNPLGYKLFPQLGSFAQFVTPDVVTRRVEDRLATQAATGKPFFWHVFYSCNHLPYRSAEPYTRMFTDPAYRGPNANGVDFDIDGFIGGTDLESKWNALPPAEVNQIRGLYDGCTRQFDTCVGRILATLEKKGLAERTIVVVTADHGDDLYEPDVTLGHGLTFNGASQANHIPMIVHVPGQPARTIPETIRSIDLMPTLADLVGVPKPTVWEGRSTAGWIKGEEQPETVPFFGETGFPFIQFSVPGVTRPKLPPMDELTSIDDTYNYQFVLKEEYRERLVEAKQRCLITRHWKLICTPTADGSRHYSLHRLATSANGESRAPSHDFARERPDILSPMRTALERWIDEHKQSTIHEIFPQGEPES